MKILREEVFMNHLITRLIFCSEDVSSGIIDHSCGLSPQLAHFLSLDYLVSISPVNLVLVLIVESSSHVPFLQFVVIYLILISM